jgi:maltose alpha-D-glucosyltransferase/alpha-amylase
MAGCAAYPADAGDVDRLIELASIEKLLYEIRYELKNRPGWVGLPWNDLCAMLEE